MTPKNTGAIDGRFEVSVENRKGYDIKVKGLAESKKYNRILFSRRTSSFFLITNSNSFVFDEFLFHSFFHLSLLSLGG